MKNSFVGVALSMSLVECALAQTLSRAVPLPDPGSDGGFDASWYTLDSGGTSTGEGAIVVDITMGQADAGVLTAPGLEVFGGFWAIVDGPTFCYANCDLSTAPPILNINDFICFLNLFAAQDARANCDLSTAAPVLNINDFVCFINAFAVGCP